MHKNQYSVYYNVLVIILGIVGQTLCRGASLVCEFMHTYPTLACNKIGCIGSGYVTFVC